VVPASSSAADRRASAGRAWLPPPGGRHGYRGCFVRAAGQRPGPARAIRGDPPWRRGRRHRAALWPATASGGRAPRPGGGGWKPAGVVAAGGRQ